jgi:hypothetical protein
MSNETARAKMFGPTPGEVRQLRNQEREQAATAAAQLPPFAGAVKAASMAGSAFGDVLGAAMGMQDPAMQQALLVEEAHREVKASGLSYEADPKAYLKKTQEALGKRGLHDHAENVRQRLFSEDIQSMEAEASKIQAEASKIKAENTRDDAARKAEEPNYVTIVPKGTHTLGPDTVFRRFNINDEAGQVMFEQMTGDGSWFQIDDEQTLRKQPTASENIGPDAQFFSQAFGALTDEFKAGAVSATEAKANLGRMATLLRDGLQTGSLQSGFLGLSRLADDLGFDLSAMARGLGIKLGDTANQEDFARLAQHFVIESFEKFKGNLNQQEVKLALGALPGLGLSEEANIRAVASLQASADMALENAKAAYEIRTNEDVTKFNVARIEGDANRWRELYNDYYNRMKFRQENIPVNAEVIELPDGSIGYRWRDQNGELQLRVGQGDTE